MAGNVNKPLVIALVGGVLVLGGAAAVILPKLAGKTAEQHQREGRDALAKADAAKASGDAAAEEKMLMDSANKLSRAVAKDQSNVALLEEWVGVLRRLAPTEAATYQRMYSEQYVRIALEGLARAKKDQKAYRDWLDEVMRPVVVRGAAQEWQVIEELADRAIAALGEENASGLRRYRAMARIARLVQSATRSESDITRAREEIQAALAADPKDDLVVSTALVMDYALADAKRRERPGAESDAAVVASFKSAEEFLKANPGAPWTTVRLSQLQMTEEMRRGGSGMPRSQLRTALQPYAARVLEALRKADAATTEPQLIEDMTRTVMAADLPTAHEDADRELERFLAARPRNPLLRMLSGDLALSAGSAALNEAERRRPESEKPLAEAEMNKARAWLEKAIKRHGEISTLPPPPLSLEGVVLARLQVDSQRQQVNASVQLVRTARDAAERTKIIDETAALRDKLAKLVPADSQDLLMADAQIALTRNENTKARQSLEKYVAAIGDRPNGRDVNAIRLLAGLLRASNAPGAARDTLRALLPRGGVTPEAMMELAELEMSLQDVRGALEAANKAVALDPGNSALVKFRDGIQQFLPGSKPTDEFIARVRAIQDLMNQRTPDRAAAVKLALEAAGKCKDSREKAVMVQMLWQLQERDAAKALLDKSIAEHTEPAEAAQLAGLRRLFEAPRTREDILKMIDEQNLEPAQKAITLYRVGTMNGWTDVADAALAQAKTLAPKNPLVVGALMDKAIAAGDVAEAKRLTDIAVEINADGLGGLIFQVQTALAERKLDEALSRAEAATRRDANSLVAWRTLGEVQRAMESSKDAKDKNFTRSIESLRKAMALSPDNGPVVSSLLISLIANGQEQDALGLARQKRSLPGVAADMQFVNLWLTLEAEQGDADRAVEVRREFFKRDPGNKSNSGMLAVLLIKGRLFDEAQKVVDAMMLTPRGQFDLIDLRTALLFARGDQAGALKLFDDAMAAADPKQQVIDTYVRFAQSQMELGQVELALAVLERGRPKQDPVKSEADRMIGDTYFNYGRYDKAMEAYQRVLTQLTSDDDGKLTMRIAESQIRVGKVKEADEFMAAAKPQQWADDSKRALILLRAETANRLGDSNRARTLLDEAVAAFPNEPTVFRRRAEFNQGDPTRVDAAKADFKKAIELNPREIPARRGLASLMLAQGDSDGAVALLREGALADPTSTPARAMLVNTLLNLGQNREALAEVERALENTLDPTWPRMAARIREALGDFTGAIEMHKRVWETEKSVAAALGYTGALLNRPTPDVKTAAAVLADPALPIDKAFPLLLARAKIAKLERRDRDAGRDLLAGLVLASQGEKAEQIYGQLAFYFNELLRVYTTPAERLAVLRDNQPAEGYGELVRVFLLRDMVKVESRKVEAVSALEQLVGSQDKVVAAAASRELGDYLYNIKEYAKAADVYKRGVELIPDDAYLLNNAGYTLSRHLGKHDEALPLVEKAARLNFSNAAVLDSLGVVQMRLNKTAEAERSLMAALQLAENIRVRTSAALHLAELYAGTGSKPKAEYLIREAERLMERDATLRTEYGQDLEAARAKLRSAN